MLRLGLPPVLHGASASVGAHLLTLGFGLGLRVVLVGARWAAGLGRHARQHLPVLRLMAADEQFEQREEGLAVLLVLAGVRMTEVVLLSRLTLLDLLGLQVQGLACVLGWLATLAY